MSFARVIRFSPTVGPEWGSSQAHHFRFSNCEFPFLTSVLWTNSHLLVLTVSFCPSSFCDWQVSLIKVKVKWSRYRPGVALRVGRGIALLFRDRSTRKSEWSAARPGRTLPPGKSRHTFYRRLGGPQGLSGRVENLVPSGIRSWTVQP